MLRIFNTLTGRIEVFTPRRPNQVKMYTCGPSVYLQPHIGNYRTFLFEDILHRYLEYLGYDVVRLITLTDVEDKSIAQADKEKIPLKQLTQRNEEVFFADNESLRMEFFAYVARSSETVDQAAKLIKILLEKGLAYWYEYKGRQNVYYDPLKFRDFGKLSKVDMSKWPRKRRRFHRDTYPGAPWNRGDFILWHGCGEDDVTCWETDIGRGRPAWNVQDAAMVTKNMGFSIDIACGGIDNLVRHHDYTIAVAEGVSQKEFSRYWLHCQHLFVDGKKMSKSRGNVYYPQDLIKRSYSGQHIRFFLIYGHYRKRLNFTFKQFAKTSKKLDAFKSMINSMQNTKSSKSSKKAKMLIDGIIKGFEKNLDNDLNVKEALDQLFKTIANLSTMREKGRLSLEDAKLVLNNLGKIDRVLQIIF